MTLALTGLTRVDSLIQGWSWTGTTGVATTVPYTFRAASELEVDPALRTAVSLALREFSNVANIRFDYQIVSSINNQQQQVRIINGVENTKSVPLIFEISGTLPSGILGVTSFPFFDQGPPTESKIRAADVDVKVNGGSLAPGGEPFVTMLHEIGHAVGFSHVDTGESQNGSTLSAVEQTTDATVMNSTFPDFNVGDATALVRPQSLMIYDVAALQYIYGVNRSYNAGDTVYEFDGTVTQARTIWDGGGIDTISSINYTGNVVIDLREGFQNVTEINGDRTGGTGTFLWMAFGSNIENARAGRGSDTIFGNSLGNRITAGKSNDSVDGGAGNDDINGNIGNDTVVGGDGDDFLRGGKDDDNIQGGIGNDLVNGNLGNDIATAGQGNDFVNGNEGNDILVGDDGSDTLRGGQDNDQIFGGAGNDIIFGDRGDDRLNGGSGADIFGFAPGFGSDVIEDFEAAGVGVIDRMQISPLLATTADEVMTKVTILDTAVYIDFGIHGNITLLGVTDIAPDDFIIG